jgi:hypothetical protein
MGSELDPEVLHGRVEALLDHRLQAMNLVDEKHVASVEGGQDAGQIALALEDRARGHADLRAHLPRQQIGERRLPQPGRSRQEHMI